MEAPARIWTALLLALLPGCSEHAIPTATIDVDGNPVRVEVAADGELRDRGLMHRKSLGKDDGMLFVYPDERARYFWMKNTRIPLDIAFVDTEGKIVRIASMRPFGTELTRSLYPARYALEMNEGWFEAHAVKPGDHIRSLPEVDAR